MFTFFQKYFILHNVKKNKEYLNSLTHLPEYIQDDEAFILKMLEVNKTYHTKQRSKKFDTLLNLVSERLKDDTDFVKNMIYQASTKNIEFASVRLRNDMAVMSMAIKKSPSCIKYMGLDLKKDIDFAYYAMQCSVSGTEFKYFDYSIQHNLEFALDTLKKRPKIYPHLPKEFKLDEQFVAIMKNYCIHHEEYFLFFHQEQKSNLAFNLELLKINPKIVQHLNQNILKLIGQADPIETLENHVLREKLINDPIEVKAAKRVKI